jgi:hypothetical protein
MSNLTQAELEKVRKSALESVTLSNEMKSTAIDEKLRTLRLLIKKLLANKTVKIEIFLTRGN